MVAVNAGSPSPLAGEGARRAGEGEAAPYTEPTVTTQANRLWKGSPRQHGYARAMRREPAEAEGQLWRLPRNRRLTGFKFRRQVPIGPYIADFACYDARLIIEPDGSQHLDSPRDLRRDHWLREDGCRILRFWNNDLTQNYDGVLNTIFFALTDGRDALR
ncbi:MAG TPA: DUF559 domain-containing protein [Devosiaceae bacterium]